MQNTSGSRRGQVFFRISPGALAEGGIAVMPKKHLTPEWFRSTRIWLILHQMQKNLFFDIKRRCRIIISGNALRFM